MTGSINPAKQGLIAREDSLFTEKFHDRIVCRAGQIARLVRYNGIYSFISRS